MPAPEKDVALLMVIAGPAGSGKSTLCERLVADYQGVERVVTSTTRAPRGQEVNGEDYYFFSSEEFDQLVAEDAFLEWAHVHANRYGTLKRVIQDKLDEQIDLVVNIDVQGVKSYQKAAENDPLIAQRLVTVFVLPPNLDELERRLVGRGQDDAAEISRRLETAKIEMEAWRDFDFVIASQSKEEDYQALKHIWQAEKLRGFRLVQAG